MEPSSIASIANVLCDASRQVDITSDRRPGNPYEAAFEALARMADGEEIPIAVIGAAAAVHYGSPRLTEAIDVAVAAPHYGRLLRECSCYGFEIERIDPAGPAELSYQGAHIKMWQQGVFADDLDALEALPHPAELGVTEGLGIASLAGWVRVKLVRGQLRDQADVVEVVKKHGQAEVREVEEYLARLPPAYLERFRQLHELARGEQQRQNDAVLDARR